MENDAATIYCPNELCQAPNPLSHKFCQRCSTPLCKRYLWVAGNESSLGQPGEILADRYLVVGKSILLDQRPGVVIQTPAVEKLEFIKPYLKLIPYRLQVPQVYGLLHIRKEGSRKDILLLEEPPVFPRSGSDIEVNLHEELTKAWGGATSMRQLNWLWQIASIWQPLANEGVASTLMEAHLMRTEGSILRLLELRQDEGVTPTLAQLGEFWRSRLLPFARNAIAEFFAEICRLLIEKEIRSGEQLILLLDRGLKEIGHSQSLQIKITTQTDTGPSRQRNEDACYPPSKKALKKTPELKAMSIVCDGIGGHDGGNVASNLAIKTIEEELKHLNEIPDEDIEPGTLFNELEKAVAVANDKISERNDRENRQGRQRMGTTLVMALPIGNEVYVTHVGDSRAYWITSHGCHQVTLDDDVASREVRLGYAIYRDALKQVASGSLVQALGMSPSLSLHPTVQRFVLDEDGVFLLCSDGLSDFDRVEQHWETQVLPVLEGRLDLATATSKLVDIANVENGHDNVTIALLHYQVKYSEPKLSLPVELADLSGVSTAHSFPTLSTSPPSVTPNEKTKVLSDTVGLKKTKIPLPLILPILVLGGGLLGYWTLQLKSDSLLGSNKTKVEKNHTKPTLTATNSPSPGLELEVNSEITTKKQMEFRTQLPFDGATIEDNVLSVMVPKGSVLEIIEKQNSKGVNPGKSGSEDWLKLRVCSIGEDTSPSKTTKADRATDTTSGGENLGTTLSADTLPADTLPAETLSPEVLSGETLSGETLPEETLPPEILSEETLPGETLPEETLTSDNLSPDLTEDSSIKPGQEVWIESSKVSLEYISISKPGDSTNSPCFKFKNRVIPQNGALPTPADKSIDTQPTIAPLPQQLPSQTPPPIVSPQKQSPSQTPPQPN